LRSSLLSPLLWCVAVFTAAALIVSRLIGVATAGRFLSSAAILAALGVAAAFFIALSHQGRIARLKNWVDHLLDNPAPASPDVLYNDDEVGLLARSMLRIPARIGELVEDLRLESARRDAILAGMVEALLAVDKDLKVILCNDAFARFAGIPPPIPPGTPLLRISREPTLLDMITAALREDSAGNGRLQPLHGNQIWQVSVTPLPMPAGRGAIALLHDITDLERLERIRRDFVANVSHELRTPLAAIRGYAETLLDGALDDEENRFRFVEIILNHAIRLNNIASDLLALSELEAKDGAEPPRPVPVHAALDSAIRIVAQEAARREIDLVFEDATPLQALGYRTRLEQVLVNLLDNAIKFNRAGGQVRLAVKQQDERVIITVADTGIGIPSDDLPRIFERFYRVDKARSRDVGGTGLGLSIVRHAVDEMNGSVTVQSELGHGTTFTVTLPAAAEVPGVISSAKP